MTVRELIYRLRKLKDQDALIVVPNGESLTEWIIASGIVELGIGPSKVNPDMVIPGRNAGIEIVRAKCGRECLTLFVPGTGQ